MKQVSKKKKFVIDLKTLGNIFIFISFLGFGLVFYPIVLLYIPTHTVASVDKTSSIVIPKINASAPLLLNVDPWNESVYKEALKHGVAHAKGTADPGTHGTSFIFAHSSGNPWEMTHYNTVFLRLSELEKGDTIYIYRDGTKHSFTVTDKKEVWPSEVSYLLDTENSDQLILQTCTPIGTDLKRLLVFAQKS